uniref:Leucine rich repeat containing 19 n=1 Tax=Leptobrachium leishanense TaxID=445787 RepID=A0A8C5LJC4_9ANUR
MMPRQGRKRRHAGQRRTDHPHVRPSSSAEAAVMKMRIHWLTVWIGIISTQMSNGAQCEDKNSSIPQSFAGNITVLDMSNHNITLDVCDQEALLNYPNLTVLNLENNNIASIPSKFFSGLSKLDILKLQNNLIEDIPDTAFEGLEQLKILDLSNNKISFFPSNVKLFQELTTLYLQNNNLTSLDISPMLEKLKSTLNITLSGNPWNCDCAFMNLSSWLKQSKVILENEDVTLCAAPENMVKVTIKEARADQLNCNRSVLDPMRTTPLLAPVNGTSSTPKKGNSWTFLVGVIAVALVTSLLILFAVKFPRWYEYLLSYNHHRLKEEEPYTFEEEFNVDSDMSTGVKGMEEDKTIVLFEQTHSFVAEDDGFIEDKYIEDKYIEERERRDEI